MRTGATELVDNACDMQGKVGPAGSYLSQNITRFAFFGRIGSPKLEKVNIFFDLLRSLETTHFCGLQTLGIARDSC